MRISSVTAGPIGALLLGVLLIASCGGQSRNEQDDGDEADISVSLSQEEAIEAAKRYVAKPDRVVRVRVPFFSTRHERVPCSAQEVAADRSARPNNPELWRCKPFAPGSSSYRKTVARQVRECCKEREIRYPGGGTWTAARSTSDDAWDVTLEFSYEDESQSVSLKVDDRDRTVSGG